MIVYFSLIFNNLKEPMINSVRPEPFGFAQESLVEGHNFQDIDSIIFGVHGSIMLS